MTDEPLRSRVARAAAEAALVRVVHHDGERPEFVVLGGLVPELLCSTSEYTHAGLPSVYDRRIYSEKCSPVFQHIFESYQGAGRSIYEEAA